MNGGTLHRFASICQGTIQRLCGARAWRIRAYPNEERRNAGRPEPWWLPLDAQQGLDGPDRDLCILVGLNPPEQHRRQRGEHLCEFGVGCLQRVVRLGRCYCAAPVGAERFDDERTGERMDSLVARHAGLLQECTNRCGEPVIVGADIGHAASATLTPDGIKRLNNSPHAHGSAPHV